MDHQELARQFAPQSPVIGDGAAGDPEAVKRKRPRRRRRKAKPKSEDGSPSE
jgi:hypothetical protein